MSNLGGSKFSLWNWLNILILVLFLVVLFQTIFAVILDSWRSFPHVTTPMSDNMSSMKVQGFEPQVNVSFVALRNNAPPITMGPGGDNGLGASGYIANWDVPAIQYQRGDPINWCPGILGQGGKLSCPLSYVEAHEFVVDRVDRSLCDYGITISFNAVEGVSVDEVYVSCGNATTAMKPSGINSFSVDLGSAPLAQYLMASRVKGVQTFTVQPYDTNGAKNIHGGRSILISTGCLNYIDTSVPWVAIDPSDIGPPQWSTFQIPSGPNEGTYSAYCGGLAWAFLNGTYGDGSVPHLIRIDEDYSAMEHHLSSSVLIAKGSGNDTVPLGIVNLDHPGKFAISGRGRLNGFSILETAALDPGLTDILQVALLEVSSSYQCQSNDFAVDVSGVTFAYPSKRYKSTVQINGRFLPVTWPGQSLNDRLVAVAENFLAGSYVSLNMSPARIFGTKLLGGWIDASDGYESIAPRSVYASNVIHTADDSIKVNSPGSLFFDTTLLQGDIGACICPTSYGEVNLGVGGCVVDGVYIHRITHKLIPENPPITSKVGGLAAEDDNLGGIVSNRTGFSPKFSQLGTITQLPGWNDMVFSTVYVPSLINTSKVDVNSVSRHISLSVVSNVGNYGRSMFLPTYSDHENHNVSISNIQFLGFDVFPKPLDTFARLIWGSWQYTDTDITVNRQISVNYVASSVTVTIASIRYQH